MLALREMTTSETLTTFLVYRECPDFKTAPAKIGVKPYFNILALLELLRIGEFHSCSSVEYSIWAKTICAPMFSFQVNHATGNCAPAPSHPLLGILKFTRLSRNMT